MAASKMAQELSDITECSVCIETYTRPKVLPCQHTFCLACLQSYGTGKTPGQLVACPLCKKEFPVPAGGFDTLPGSFLIEKLLDIQKMSNSTPMTVLRCDNCLKSAAGAAAASVPAIAHCFDCPQNMCSSCLEVHKSTKVLASHQVVMLDSPEWPEELIMELSGKDVKLPVLGSVAGNKSEQVMVQQTPTRMQPEYHISEQVPCMSANTEEDTRCRMLQGQHMKPAVLLSMMAVPMQQQQQQQQSPVAQYASSPTLISKIPSIGNRVTGLTLLGDNVYAVRPGQQYVTEYDSTSLRHKRNINIAASLTAGWDVDIASCALNNCLYVSDKKTRSVCRVQLPAASLTVWSMQNQPYKLSVTPTSTVLVICDNDNMLREFTTHGTHVRSIAVHPDITSLQHAIQLQTGHYLLSDSGMQHRVLKVSSDGRNIIKSYGWGSGSLPGQLSCPRRIVLQNGFVLVADYDNNRVQVLTADLVHVRDLINKTHGLRKYPESLCLGEKSGKLFIGSSSGEIQVYQITTGN